MEDYIVSARKYRPMSFDSVVGQSALTTTLKNAVKSGKLAHAYLFCGPRGVGKTTCARIFAKAINCEHPHEDGEACNECESCKSFNEGRSYNIFELDAASNNSVDDIKSLMEQTRIPPQIGKYKVFIIDEVHMLSPAAFNAFLKTLEEPPSHVIFILATTEKNKILPTILSRCQIYDFERMTVANTINHLKMVAEKEGVQYEEQALEVIAEKADGGMRDALSIFDQTAGFCQGNITYQKVIEDLNVLDSDNYFKIIDLAIDNKVSDIMVLLNNIIEKGFDGLNLINGIASHIRNVLMAKDEQTIALLECSEKQKARYSEQAKKCPTPFLYSSLKLLNECDIHYRQSSNKRLLVELTFIQIAQLTQPADVDVPGVGRQPHRLKSLFKNLLMSQPKPAPQVAGAENSLNDSSASSVSQNRIEPNAVASSVTEKKEEQKKKSVGGIANVKLGRIGFTFNNIQNKSKETVTNELPQADVTSVAGREEVFGQDKLELSWMEMCSRMPKPYFAMASRMKNMKPTIIEFPKVEVVVDNKVMLDQIMPIRTRIQATLIKSLCNVNIQLTFRLAKADEVVRILSSKELFEQMQEKNPSIKKLTDSLGLVLS